MIDFVLFADDEDKVTKNEDDPKRGEDNTGGRGW